MTTTMKMRQAVAAAKRGVTTTVRDDLGRVVATVQPVGGRVVIASAAGVSRL